MGISDGGCCRVTMTLDQRQWHAASLAWLDKLFRMWSLPSLQQGDDSLHLERTLFSGPVQTTNAALELSPPVFHQDFFIGQLQMELLVDKMTRLLQAWPMV